MNDTERIRALEEELDRLLSADLPTQHIERDLERLKEARKRPKAPHDP